MVELGNGDPGRSLSPEPQWVGLRSASGHEVVFSRSPTGAGAEQAAWFDRCAALASVRYPHLVELVDYGLIGATHCFEVLRMPCACSLWRARDPAAGVALRSVVSFLHGRRMSAGRIGWNRLVNLNGGPALEPDRHRGAPWPDEADGSSPEPERRSLTALILECGRRTCRLSSAGVSLQPVPAIQHITEVLDEGRGSRGVIDRACADRRGSIGRGRRGLACVAHSVEADRRSRRIRACPARLGVLSPVARPDRGSARLGRGVYRRADPPAQCCAMPCGEARACQRPAAGCWGQCCCGFGSGSATRQTPAMREAAAPAGT